MSYGNSTPPDPDAPVAPPELIGASLFLGLIAVLSISSHGSYLVALVFGQAYFDLVAVAGILVSFAGFAASLWYLALRWWAWRLAVAYCVFEVGFRGYSAVADLAPSLVHPGVTAQPRIIPAVGEVALGLLFLVVLAYITSPDSRGLLAARAAYRLRKAQVAG